MTTLTPTAPTHQNYLREAVEHSSPYGISRMLQRMFTLWFNHLVYSQIWEDPRVDLKALNLTETSEVLTISSAGCNVLNYLVAEPRRVVAIDLNSSHLNLLRLKLAAMQHLPSYELFLKFFGEANSADNLSHYWFYIRPHLAEETQQYWEGGSWFEQLRGKNRLDYFANGFYRHSRCSQYLRFLNRLTLLLGGDPKEILNARSQSEQRELFNQTLGKAFDHWIVKFLGKIPCMVYSLGIPPQQFESLKRDSRQGVVATFRERVDRLICGFPIETNYFARQALVQNYNCGQQEGLPLYLQEKHYSTIKSSVQKVTTVHGSLIDYLKAQPQNSFSSFVFLDAQDWMTTELLTALWTEVARVGRAGGRIIFRTAGEISPIENRFEKKLSSHFRYLPQLSQELHSEDRSAIYGGFHVYQLNEGSAS